MKKKQVSQITIVRQDVKTMEADDKRISTCTGVAGYGGVVWKYGLNAVADKHYPLRGRISALNPNGKGIMQLQGSDRRKKIKDKFGDMEPTPKQYSEALGIWCTVRSKTDAADDLDDINVVLTAKIKELYANNISSILHILQQTITPQTITPIAAWALHGATYLGNRKKRADWTQKTYDNYSDQLMTLFSAFPLGPMGEITAKNAAKVIKQVKPTSTIQRMTHGFWGYCLETGVCHGINPIPMPDKGRVNVEKLQRNASVLTILNDKQDAKLFQALLGRAATDSSAVGAALVRYAGFSPKEICEFCWRNIIMDDHDPDYVRVLYRIDDNAGATHDYTRPVMVQAARLLRIRKAALAVKYSDEELTEMPIVSQLRDPTKKMTVNNLVQRATDYLRDAGVTGETLAAHKSHGSAVAKKLLLASYKYDLEHNCGLDREPGTIRFLLGRSLTGDVTSDNYTSFTDVDGQWRLYRHLRCTMPDEALAPQQVTTDLDNNTEVHYVGPSSTGHRVTMTAKIILQPGQCVTLKHLQGLNGKIRARGLNPDNTPRRARKRNIATGNNECE